MSGFEISGWSLAVYVDKKGRKWAWYRGLQIFIRDPDEIQEREAHAPSIAIDDEALRADANAAAAALTASRAREQRPQFKALAGGRVNRPAQRANNLDAIRGGHPDVNAELAEFIDEVRATHFARLRQPFAPLTDAEAQAIEEHIDRWWSYQTSEVPALQAQLQQNRACWPARFGAG